MDAYSQMEMTNYYIAMNTLPSSKPTEQAVYIVDGYGQERCIIVDVPTEESDN
jgi:predicted metal-dependent TIM-barrel fold hydrolase